MAINGSQDFETSLYKKTAGKILHLILDTIASKVLMNNGKTVEYEINNVKERAELGISIGSKAQNKAEAANSAAQAAQNTANLKLDSQGAAEYLAGNGMYVEGNKLNVDNNAVGGTFLYDGTIDFDDEEQVSQISTGKPLGATIAYDCCSDPDCPTGDDPIYINGIYNTKEYITETGDYTAPVTGEYKITIIAGGDGAIVDHATNYAKTGTAGNRREITQYLTKGQVIPVIVGAGGIGIVGPYSESVYGGFSKFGVEASFAVDDPSVTHWGKLNFFYTTIAVASAFGPNANLDHNSADADLTGYFPGGGGSLILNYNGINKAGDGAPGCIIVEYYDAAKDKNISIDMASSVTIKELQSQFAALDARVQELENGQQ